MINQRTEPVYSDLDLDFTLNPITKDVSLKYDAEAIKRSLKNLIFTSRYERLFQPEINAGIDKLLFENYGSIQLVTLRSRLEQTIINFETRVTEVSVEVGENIDRNSLVIDIIFRIRNIPDLQEISIDLQRVR